MQTILIIVLIAILSILIIKKVIKLNFVSLFLLALIGVSIFSILTVNDGKVTYVSMNSSDEIAKIWDSFSNQKLRNDVQITRTLNPYKVNDKMISEPNQVVTDETYIYSISESRVVVTRTKDLKVVHQYQYIGQIFRPMLLYVTSDKLIVIGEVGMKTRCYIYDKNTNKEIKNFEVDATYITSRLINDELYLVTSKIIESKKETKIRPSYLENGKEKYVPYQNIYYINNTYPNNYVNILKTNINKKEDIQMMSYLGLGQVIYFTANHIYVAEEAYAKASGNSNKTILIKIDNNDLSLKHLQDVKGYVLDQYSLDEYNGYLRVATSSNDSSHMRESNNIFILNESFDIVGKLENFSIGNEIQAAVFIKEKAYIETFNILDPFYVIDLSNVKKPQIISEIEFAGYNTNFVPFDENHILAFGLILNDNKQSIGLKVSLYDVTNPKDVRLEAKESILYSEYNSAYTEVLYDCKSLLLDKENGILGFPIIYWMSEPGTQKSYYKQFYSLYKIDKDQGIKRLGKISHYEKGTKQDANDDIKRGLIISGALYTVSDQSIKKNRLSDLALIDEIYL